MSFHSFKFKDKYFFLISKHRMEVSLDKYLLKALANDNLFYRFSLLSAKLIGNANQ